MRGLVALCLMAAGPVGACPVAADLERGIEVVFGDGSPDSFAMVYSRRADGAILEAEAVEGGEVFAMRDGLMANEYHEEGIGGAVKPEYSTYDFDLTFPLQPWTSFSGLQTDTDRDGKTTTHPVKINILGEAELTIGPCSYAVIETETFTFYQGYTNHLRQDYIPSLGIGLLRGFAEVGVAQSDTTYILESIEAVE